MPAPNAPTIPSGCCPGRMAALEVVEDLVLVVVELVVLVAIFPVAPDDPVVPVVPVSPVGDTKHKTKSAKYWE